MLRFLGRTMVSIPVDGAFLFKAGDGVTYQVCNPEVSIPVDGAFLFKVVAKGG